MGEEGILGYFQGGKGKNLDHASGKNDKDRH